MSGPHLKFYHQPWFRAFLLVVAIVIVFFVARDLATPASFGQYGYYRGQNVNDWATREVAFSGGSTTCQACHQDKHEAWAAGPHAGINCESCHGPAAAHPANPGQVRPEVPAGREFCALCHDINVARAKAVQQVDVAQHNPGPDCTTCHNPHRPLPVGMGGKQ
ncbi:MAG: hypothetical protein D9V47_02545 [Clostridia bacterium]|nr:MAG: hypothetical protein D9V47_02545 [Clostridia bacterium]